MRLVQVRHRYPEQAGFVLDRPKGLDEFVFVHFLTPVVLTMNGKEQPLPPGCCLLYNVATPQHWTSPGPLVHDWFHLTGSDVPEIVMACGVCFDHIYRPRDAAFISETVRCMQTEFFSKKVLFDRMCSLYTEQLLVQLARDESAPNQHGVRESFEGLRLYLYTHLTEEWSIQRMAERVSFSPARFFRLYKDFFGISPMADLIGARISAAERYLSLGQYSVQEIAALTGYQSVYHFIRQFKGAVGMSPGAYAAACRREPCKSRSLDA